MAKAISTTQVRGRVSRIYIRAGDTQLSSIVLMLEGDPRVYNMALSKSPSQLSLKLTKPGDDVSFLVHKERAFIIGEHEVLLQWNNWSLAIEQTRNGVKPEDSIHGQPENQH